MSGFLLNPFRFLSVIKQIVSSLYSYVTDSLRQTTTSTSYIVPTDGTINLTETSGTNYVVFFMASVDTTFAISAKPPVYCALDNNLTTPLIEYQFSNKPSTSYDRCSIGGIYPHSGDSNITDFSINYHATSTYSSGINGFELCSMNLNGNDVYNFLGTAGVSGHTASGTATAIATSVTIPNQGDYLIIASGSIKVSAAGHGSFHIYDGSTVYGNLQEIYAYNTANYTPYWHICRLTSLSASQVISLRYVYDTNYLYIRQAGIVALDISKLKNLYYTSSVIPVIDASGNGSTATLTFEAQSIIPFPVGTTIDVTGVSVSSFNGSGLTVTDASTSSVSYSSTASGSSTSGLISLVYSATTPEYRLPVTNASEVGNTASVKFSTQSAAPVQIDDYVTIQGVTSPTDYNLVNTPVTSATSSTISYTIPTSGLSGWTGTGAFVYGIPYISITSATVNTATAIATLNFTAQLAAPFTVGGFIKVSGVSNSAYNGIFIVTACSTTTVNYSCAATTSSSGGKIYGEYTFVQSFTINNPANYHIILASAQISYGSTTNGLISVEFANLTSSITYNKAHIRQSNSTSEWYPTIITRTVTFSGSQTPGVYTFGWLISNKFYYTLARKIKNITVAIIDTGISSI